MDVSKKNYPSLPANYVSLADLQRRWMKQQQEKREEQEPQPQPQPQQPMLANQDDNVPEIAKPGTQINEPISSQISANPSFKTSKRFRDRNRVRKVPQVYRLVQHASATVRTGVEINGGEPKVKNEKVMKKETWSEKTMKKVSKSSEIEAHLRNRVEIDGCDQLVDDQIGGKLKVKDEKKKRRRRSEKKMKKVVKSESSGIEANVPIGASTDGCDKQVDEPKKKGERKMKTVPKSELLKVEANVTIGTGTDGGNQVAEPKKKEEKKMKKAPKLEWSEIGANVTTGAGTEGGDQHVDEKQMKRKNNSKTKQNPVPEKQSLVMNLECGEGREIQGKGGSEVAERPNVGGHRTVEIGRGFERLYVTGRGKGRWTPARRVYGSYGSIGHRGSGIKQGENGLVWVKKGVVSEHTEVS